MKLNFYFHKTQINSKALVWFMLFFIGYTIDINAQIYDITNSSINDCAGTFHDSGGSGGNYGLNENYTSTICSNNGGQIQLNFTAFAIENTFDFLTIYDGANTGATQLGQYTGTNSPGFITGSGTCLTINFTSDNIQVEAGWAASISCLAPPDGPGFPNCVNGNEIGGIAFLDLSGDGLRTSDEGPYQGATVNLFDDNGLVSSMQTDANGEFLFTSLDPATTYRIEYTWAESWLNPSFSEGTNGTTVQFVTPGNCDANIGLYEAVYFCEDVPLLTTPCYVSGDPLAGGGAASLDALVTYGFDANGSVANPNGGTTPTEVSDAADLGTVWGGTYQRETESLFTTAFLKRHAGLGSEGLGGIYLTDMATNVTTPYIDLADFGITLASAADLTAINNRNLPADAVTASTDADAFDLVGKVGLGGATASPDGETLYVTNLYDKSLIAINIGNPAKPGSSITAADITSYPMPLPTCTNGEARPWSSNYYNGKVYVGLVCSGENGGSAADLSAHVYTFDITSNTFDAAPVLTFPLNYGRGDIHVLEGIDAEWMPWTDTFSDLNITGPCCAPESYRVAGPQPMLSDIEFTSTGDMIIGLMDRTGHQTGRLQEAPIDDGLVYNGYIGGDILRASLNGDGTTFTLESNGSSGNYTGCGAGNGEGPGGGEFFCNDEFYDSENGNVLTHDEIFQGSMIVVPGTDIVVTNMMDPWRTWSGGSVWYDANTGAELRRYEIYYSLGDDNVTYGKANGLGTLEALCAPAPIEIGNRVWVDADGDGIQDPGEDPIAGVTINLYDANGNVIATTTTDANGYYYFGNNNVPGGLDYSETYYITVENYDPTNGITVNGDDLVITTDDVNGDGDNSIDSDGALAAGVDPSVDNKPYVEVFTGNSGQNDHRYDFGFRLADQCPLITGLTDSNTGDYCYDGTPIDITYTLTTDQGTIPTDYTVVWTVDGIVQADTDSILVVSLTPTDNCTPLTSPVITASIVCVDTGETGTPFTNTSTAFTIYPTPQASDYIITDNACTVMVTDNCGGNLVITNDQGGGSSFTIAQGSPAQTVNFTIKSDNNAPANCEVIIPLTATCPNYDLRLGKVVDAPLAEICDEVVYTLTVYNEGSDEMTGVEVTDQLPTGVLYTAGNYIASQGTFDGTIWDVGTVAAGDSATLNITVNIAEEGVQYNIAEITAADQIDLDSAPNNGDLTEDDIAAACVSIPVEVCTNDAIDVLLEAPAGYTTYQWYKDGAEIVGAVGAAYTATEIGEYTYIVDGGDIGSCMGELCCPIIITVVDCCPAPRCIPLTIQKKAEE